MSSLDYVPCEDFTPFKNALMKHRKTDDNVMHLLNTTNVHSETKCQELFAAFTKSHAERGVLINRCLNVQIQKVDDLKKQLEVDKNNLNLKTELRTEQLKKRLLETEVTQEEIIQERTQTALKEKCSILFDTRHRHQ